MQLDFRKVLIKDKLLTEQQDFQEIKPGCYVWSQGYVFEGDDPKVGKGLSQAVFDALGSGDVYSRLSELNGSYCAVLISTAERTIEIVSDRWATRPLYNIQAKDNLFLATDFWDLLQHLPRPQMSIDAAVELLTYDYVLGNHTLVQDIMEIPRASYIKYMFTEQGRLEKKVDHCYWSYDIRPENRNGDVIVSGVAEMLEQTGARHCHLLEVMGIGTMGLNLTAGFDSRVLAYFLHRHGKSFYCFTSREIGEENRAAFEVAKSLNAPHVFVSSRSQIDTNNDLCEKMFWTVAPTTMALCNHMLNLAALGPWPVDGFLTGHMGDPVTGRQAGIKSFFLSKKQNTTLCDYIVKKHTSRNPGLVLQLLSKDFKNHACQGVDKLRNLCDKTNLSISNQFTLVSRIDFEQRQRRFILRDYQTSLHLGFGMLPFADYGLWDYFATVPFAWQIGSQAYIAALHKHLFKGRYESLGQIPINGRRHRPTRHPMAKNIMMSAIAQGEGKVKQIMQRLSHSQRRGKVSSEREFLNRQLAEPLVQILDSLAWCCDIDFLHKQIVHGKKEGFDIDFRAVYTLAKVSSRLQGGK